VVTGGQEVAVVAAGAASDGLAGATAMTRPIMRTVAARREENEERCTLHDYH